MMEDGKHAVILAGGQGVRLRPYTTSIPKPLVPIGGEMSILEIVLRQLRAHGFTSVTLAIGHLGQIIRAYVGDGSAWDIDVTFHLEQEPLGTIGPLLYMKDYLPERFVVMNGDILTDLNYRALMDEHTLFDADVTVATYSREVKIDFGVPARPPRAPPRRRPSPRRPSAPPRRRGAAGRRGGVAVAPLQQRFDDRTDLLDGRGAARRLERRARSTVTWIRFSM